MQTPSEERLVALLDQWSPQWTWWGRQRAMGAEALEAMLRTCRRAFSMRSMRETEAVAVIYMVAELCGVPGNKKNVTGRCAVASVCKSMQPAKPFRSRSSQSFAKWRGSCRRQCRKATSVPSSHSTERADTFECTCTAIYCAQQLHLCREDDGAELQAVQRKPKL